MKRLEIVVAAAFLLLPVLAAAAEKPETLRGTCMGTIYAVTVVDRPTSLPLETLSEQISNELERIEQIFSLYRPTSELSRLNGAASGEWIGVSRDLLAVASRARELAEATEGAFDPTVGPLVKLWRLRQVNANWSPPPREAIATVRRHVGWRLIEIRPEPASIRKLAAGVELDLNALVEGWAIDRVSQMLVQKRINNALIELGGEFRGLGHKADGQPWRIGIENPHESGVCYATAALENAAVSTSGNYRDPIEHQGRRYSHVFDARRGEPVQHDLIAVSVIADNALTADGWATALLARGPVEGLALAEKKGLAASFVTRNSAKMVLSTAAKGRITLEPSH
jgi:thiamine biosynthesis lipoprotein